eukprot:4177227-Pyramimonas_sp.AAC.1
MQLGFRPMRMFAIIREIIGYFISENQRIGYPGRIIRPDMMTQKKLIQRNGPTNMPWTAAFVRLLRPTTL